MVLEICHKVQYENFITHTVATMLHCQTYDYFDEGHLQNYLQKNISQVLVVVEETIFKGISFRETLSHVGGHLKVRISTLNNVFVERNISENKLFVSPIDLYTKFSLVVMLNFKLT